MSDMQKSSFYTKIKVYKGFKDNIALYLEKYPNNWVEFVCIFNAIYDSLINQIKLLDKNSLEDSKKKIIKFKKVFERRYRKYFLNGRYVKWCFDKPYGYAGDFQIIDDIYLNNPKSLGFERLWDNHFLNVDACVATRRRKNDFKSAICDFIKQNNGRPLRIMNLASGPAREIKELLEEYGEFCDNVIFDCYDFSDESIEYAKNLLKNFKNVNFIKKNALRIALRKNINSEICVKYDLIYSTGLFDYLNHVIAKKLVLNLKKLLVNNGELLISNYREKSDNPSFYLMEWITDWVLIYRTKEEFENVFFDAGFSGEQVRIEIQSGGVMQYAFVKNY